MSGDSPPRVSHGDQSWPSPPTPAPKLGEGESPQRRGRGWRGSPFCTSLAGIGTHFTNRQTRGIMNHTQRDRLRNGRSLAVSPRPDDIRMNKTNVARPLAWSIAALSVALVVIDLAINILAGVESHGQ